MGTIRKIQQGADALNSASVVNRPHEDVLAGSRYSTDGLNFSGFAQTQEGIPIVASAAARDALFPAPIANQRVARSDTGYVERYDAPLVRWIPEGLMRTAGPVVSAIAKGCKADG